MSHAIAAAATTEELEAVVWEAARRLGYQPAPFADYRREANECRHPEMAKLLRLAAARFEAIRIRH